MEIKGRRATWLELALAPLGRIGQAQLQVHALGGGQAGCLALTLDDRWLCANDGRLTVFKGREAVLRFLKLLRIERVQEGDARDLPVACGQQDMQCMCLGRRGLRACALSSGRCGGSPPVKRAQAAARASSSSDFMR